VDAEQFSKFRHDAVHALMRLNEAIAQQFRLSSWPRYDYELKAGTLTFSKDGIPGVIASIQVVGTTSKAEGTWLWSWANASLPNTSTDQMETVRAFGEGENLSLLKNPYAEDDEYLGWAMTAIAAKILDAKGGYRCPSGDGFIYFVYTDLAFAEINPALSEKDKIQCDQHDVGIATFICEHLSAAPNQEWFSDARTEIDPWPDAWCSQCESLFQEQDGWNGDNISKRKIVAVCNQCYDGLRTQEVISEDDN
jgi:hypothetical protein